VIAVRLAGSGGQGIQLAGVVLAEAAIAAGWNAACMQTYGPESRGGASRCDVVLDRGEIYFPQARHPDVLVALSADACRCFLPDVRPGGLVLCDAVAMVETPPPHLHCRALPIVETARTVGTPLVANAVALGALCALTELVPLEVLARALAARRPEPRNQRALQAGFSLGEAARLDGGSPVREERG